MGGRGHLIEYIINLPVCVNCLAWPRFGVRGLLRLGATLVVEIDGYTDDSRSVGAFGYQDYDD